MVEKRTTPAIKTNKVIERNQLEDCRVVTISACHDSEMFVDLFVDFLQEAV
jgi:hypothetical protein